MTKPDFSDVWNSLVSGKWTLLFTDYIGTLIDAKPDLDTVDRLQQILDQYPDWDGYEANPVNAESLMRVRHFVMELPDDVEKPELVPEPDGDVVMVWTKDGRHLCIVGIKPTEKLVVSIFQMGHLNHLIGSKYELYAFLQSAYLENKGEKE